MKVSSHIHSRGPFPAVTQVLINHCTLGFVKFKTGLIAFVKTLLAHSENRTTRPWSSATLSSPNAKYAIHYSRSYWVSNRHQSAGFLLPPGYFNFGTKWYLGNPDLPMVWKSWGQIQDSVCHWNYNTVQFRVFTLALILYCFFPSYYCCLFRVFWVFMRFYVLLLSLCWFYNRHSYCSGWRLIKTHWIELNYYYSYV